MYKTALAFIAALAASGALHAHCGACSTGEGSADKDGHACADHMLTAYFEVQQALANDNLGAAQEHAKQLLGDSKEAACPMEEKDGCQAIQSAAKDIAKASEIAEARKAFLQLSEQFIAQVEESGTSREHLYKMRCPMAFNNKGAVWLQSNISVKNPYYGATMLSCGVNQADLAAKQQVTDHHHPSDS